MFNRGQTRDDLPEEVERLRGDRTKPEELKRVLTGREFDLVIDTTLYTGSEAEAAVELFAGKVGRYIFLSTGQVYLVRVGAERPYKEDDYAGPVMTEPPKSDVSEYENWRYGFDKRAAEDVFASAWTKDKFPFTSLRLPMVNSERDHYDRIYGYFLRIQDEGPILIPDEDGAPVRHVYGEDVVQAILRLAESDKSKGCAYNIGQDETLSLTQFLELLAETMHCPLKIVRVPREELDREGLVAALLSIQRQMDVVTGECAKQSRDRNGVHACGRICEKAGQLFPGSASAYGRRLSAATSANWNLRSRDEKGRRYPPQAGVSSNKYGADSKTN